MKTPLERLIESGVAERVSAESLERFAAGDKAILLITGDAARRPEASDVAVVARELARAVPGLRVGVAEPALEASAKARFSTTLVPSVVFLRAGATVASLERLQTWSAYLETARKVFGEAEVAS